VGHLFHLHPDTEVVALCENLADRHADARRLLPNLKATYTEFDAMLEHGLDAVYIVNFPYEHVPLILKAFEAVGNQ